MMHDEAWRSKELPAGATAVYERIKVRQRDYLKESQFQRQVKVEAAFTQLSMGNMKHGEFRVKFEACLIGFRKEGMMQYLNAELLHRKYLEKLPGELRKRIMQGQWHLDGEDSPARKTRSWEEVAQALQIDSESNWEVKALGETVRMTGEGGMAQKGLQKCKHCQYAGHLPNMCPSVAAKVAGES